MAKNLYPLSVDGIVDNIPDNIIISRVFSNLNNMREIIEEGEVNLSTLFQLKCNPYSLASNLRLDSKPVMEKEIQRVIGKTIVVDLTSDQSRDIMSLYSLSLNLTKKSYRLVACTGPYVMENFVDLPIESVVQQMRSELLLGLSIPTPDSPLTQSKVHIGAISLPIHSMSPDLNANDIKALECIARLFTSFLSQSPPAPLPPLFLEFPHWVTSHSSVLSTFLSFFPPSLSSLANSSLCSVVLCHNSLSVSSVSYFSSLLSEYPNCSLAVDSFGTGTVECSLSPSIPSYSNDKEMIQSLCQLLSNSSIDRLILSPHCRYKIHLSMYGGYGFNYLQSNSIRSYLIQTGISPEDLVKLTSLNSYRVCSWSPALPPPLEREVEYVMCQICQKRVKLDESYSKFTFSYCSGRCLNEHRKKEWK